MNCNLSFDQHQSLSVCICVGGCVYVSEEVCVCVCVCVYDDSVM